MKATYALQLDVVEDIALGLDLSAATQSVAQTIARHTKGQMSDSTTPAIDRAWSDRRALVAGADSINLAALTRGALANVDMTGKFVRAIKVSALEANTQPVVFAPGASNGYAGLPEFSLGPGESAQFLFTSAAKAAVGAANRTIDVTGTGTEGYEIIVVAGPALA